MHNPIIYLGPQQKNFKKHNPIFYLGPQGPQSLPKKSERLSDAATAKN